MLPYITEFIVADTVSPIAAKLSAAIYVLGLEDKKYYSHHCLFT
jgi:hypothetical protein